MWRTAEVVLLVVSLLPASHQQFSGGVEKSAKFKAELFLNRDEITSGLYEGEVIGRKLFGDSQVPHGFGTIYYFTTDKFHRVNYTGDWRDGTRSGNGTTHFKDGAVYTGEYKEGLEHGTGFIRYPNGNTLDAEFVGGKIQGHGVFRYSNGDQREGFFRNNILDGQVIFTRINGETVIESWVNGKKVTKDGVEIPKNTLVRGDEERLPDFGEDSRPAKPKTTTTNKPIVIKDTTSGVNLDKLREAIRSGDKTAQFSTSGRAPKSTGEDDISRIGAATRQQHKKYLLSIFGLVNK